MLGIRHLNPGLSSELRPGENKEFLCTAPNEVAAEALIRSLAIHEIDSATQCRSATASSARDEIPRPVAVDVLVRGSDLERARRVVSQSFGGYSLGT
jgi:hypothetical protein